MPSDLQSSDEFRFYVECTDASLDFEVDHAYAFVDTVVSDDASDDCIKWSDNKDLCPTDTECLIPAGETWCLDADMDVATLTIEGSLIWDTTIAGTKLRIGYSEKVQYELLHN